MRGVRKAVLGAVVPAALFLAGCGYALVGQGGQFPAGIDRVAVPVFGNTTKNTEIARGMTDSFVQELQATGKVEVVSTAEAQAVIRGVVTRYEVERITFDTAGKVTQNRLRVSVDVGLFPRGEEVPLFEEKGITRYQEYDVAEDLAQERKQEEEARTDLSRELSQKVISLMAEGF